MIKYKTVLFVIICVALVVWSWIDFSHGANLTWVITQGLYSIVVFIYGYVIGNPKYD